MAYNMIDDSRGDRIRWAMSRADGGPVTQAQLAEVCGVTQQTINSILTGKRPGTAHLEKIAGFLNVPWAWLKWGDSPPTGYKEDEAGRARLKREPPPAPARTELSEFAWEELERAAHSALAARVREIERRLDELSDLFLETEQRDAARRERRQGDPRNRLDHGVVREDEFESPGSEERESG